MYSLKTTAHFDAAHFLTNYDGKCENLHGHRWQVIVKINADALQKSGQEKDMVIDFGKFKQQVRTFINQFDHTFIVEKGSLSPDTISALENETFRLKIVPFRTTTENLARYFFEELTHQGLKVCEVQVFETPDNCAIYHQ